MKCFCLQQHRHPVLAALVFSLTLEFRYFVGARLIPGQHDVEQVTVDRDVLDPVAGPPGYSARKYGGNRVSGNVAATLDDFLDLTLVVNEFERAGHDIDRAPLGIAFLEHELLGRQLADLDFSCQGSKIVALQTIQRRKFLEQVYVYLLIRHWSSCHLSI